MRKIKSWILTIMIMTIMSALSLLVVSVFSYIFKWQADKALMGITITYILAGFSGGLCLKKTMKESMSVGLKMLETILLSTIFMMVLMVLSAFVVQNPFVISSRMLMIWMLLVGSACIGRIL